MVLNIKFQFSLNKIIMGLMGLKPWPVFVVRNWFLVLTDNTLSQAWLLSRHFLHVQSAFKGPIKPIAALFPPTPSEQAIPISSSSKMFINYNLIYNYPKKPIKCSVWIITMFFFPWKAINHGKYSSYTKMVGAYLCQET